MRFPLFIIIFYFLKLRLINKQDGEIEETEKYWRYNGIKIINIWSDVIEDDEAKGGPKKNAVNNNIIKNAMYVIKKWRKSVAIFKNIMKKILK